MRLQSPAFDEMGEVPQGCTCDGDGRSPALSWTGVPEGTRSLALISDDPDVPDPAAPQRIFVHWVLYDIPPETAGLSEGVSQLPPGTKEGLNDAKNTGFHPPCPPIGRHRYYFKLYALDTMLPDLREPTKAELEGAMEGHLLGFTELIGTYQRK